MDTEIRRKTKIVVDPDTGFLDKSALRAAVAELNERLGFVPDPDATAAKARDMMLASGIRPEDNEFSHELKRMRSGESRK